MSTQQPLLISLHMPKTAGSSFRATLEECYGDKFRYDYADYPLAQTAQGRQRQALRFAADLELGTVAQVECIHGHYLPLKYLPLADWRACRFVTWLRDPADRLVSHYNYWQRSYEAGSPLTTDLHRRVVEERWTLEAFCMAPQLHNVYNKFLWGFPLRYFDFIGVSEFYEDELRYFSTHFLGGLMPPHALNRSDESGGGKTSALSADLRAEIERHHRADFQLYRRACARRAQRLQESAEGAGSGN